MAKRYLDRIEFRGENKYLATLSDLSFLDNVTTINQNVGDTSMISGYGNSFGNVADAPSSVTSKTYYPLTPSNGAVCSNYTNLWDGGVYYTDFEIKIDSFECGRSLQKQYYAYGPTYLYIVIDDETHEGWIGIINATNGGTDHYCSYGKVGNVDYIYNAFGNVVEYNWQSVPSISGKNGILSLVTLDSEAINDGEPVSGAAVSVFDQAPSTDNNVKDLADTYGSGEESSAVDVTVKYKVTLPPGGAFSVLKLVAKKDSIPEDATDGDKIVDISPTKTKKTVTGLDENSMYYFKIFAEDSNSNTSESDEKHILTSGDEGYNFDYTGEIVEWTVPKTGIYSLETWGAQGGEATDGTNSARGGYGAYAYGEVLLTQGEKLYINVGGQNGYGGGGNYTSPNNS